MGQSRPGRADMRSRWVRHAQTATEFCGAALNQFRGHLRNVGGDILNPDGDDVAATKLAGDRQIELGEVASAAFDLEFRPD